MSTNTLCSGVLYLTVTGYSEEAEEDVRARIDAIQENEIDQLRELTNALDLELDFAEQYLEILKATKVDWTVK